MLAHCNFLILSLNKTTVRFSKFELLGIEISNIRYEYGSEARRNQLYSFQLFGIPEAVLTTIHQSKKYWEWSSITTSPLTWREQLMCTNHLAVSIV